ncbi:MAG: DUF5658 family protein [Candidatus Aminicenantales bacterium]
MTDERRSFTDRRVKPTMPISRYTFTGRRRKARRLDELDNYYVDRYEIHLLILVGFIFILCALDAVFSLKIIQLGGGEWNLLMCTFLKVNAAFALIVKFLLTAVCLFFLLIHKNFRVFGLLKTHTVIIIIFAIYFMLVLYETHIIIWLNRM